MRERYFLREWRKKRMISQTDLAKLADVNQATISLIETSPLEQRQFQTIQKLAKALGILPTQLLSPPPEGDAEDLRKDFMQPTQLPVGLSREEFIDQVLVSIKLRGDLTQEDRKKIVDELLNDLFQRYSQGSGASASPDGEGA